MYIDRARRSPMPKAVRSWISGYTENQTNVYLISLIIQSYNQTEGKSTNAVQNTNIDPVYKLNLKVIIILLDINFIS